MRVPPGLACFLVALLAGPIAAQERPTVPSVVLPSMSRLVPSVVVPDMADAAARRTFEAEVRRVCAREVEIVADSRASTSPRGALLAQDPPPGTRLSCTAPRVSITLSAGPATRIERLPTELRLPDLRVTPVEPAQDSPPPPPPLIVPDLSEPEARMRFSRLVMARCDRPLDLIEDTAENDAPAGTIVAQRPPPGVTLSCRRPQVILILSSGPAPPPEPRPSPPPEPRPIPQPPPEPRPEPQPQPPPQPEPRPAPQPIPQPAPEPRPSPQPEAQPAPPLQREPRPEPQPQPPPQPEPRPEPQPQPPPQPEPRPEPVPEPPPPPEPQAGLPWPWIAGTAFLAALGFLAGRVTRRSSRPGPPDASIARGPGQVSAEVLGGLDLAAPAVGIRWRMPPPTATLLPKGNSHG